MISANKRSVCVYTLGCRLNHSETATITDRLQRAGFEVVGQDAAADVYIVNTCTVTAEADAKSRKMVRAFLRRNPAAFVAVIGCYSQTDAGAIARIPGVDLVMGSNRKLDVVCYIRDEKNPKPEIVCDAISGEDFSIHLPEQAAEPMPAHPVHRINLKIQDGCDCMCSYCIVPFARGRPRSRDFENLINEARAWLRRGVKELVLSGVNLGVYSQDGKSIIDIADRLNELKGLARIRISSIELTTLTDALLERMANTNHALLPFLHVPVQSGSNAVLRAMNRPYTANDFCNFLSRAAKSVPDLCIGTDIMVGFPGESEEDFIGSCRLVEDAPIAYAHVFKYSDRKGTRASRMTDKIDPRVSHRRSEALRRISDEKWRQFQSRFIGRRRDVLFEQQVEGFWQGHTDNYLFVMAKSDTAVANAILPVTLREVRGESIFGIIE